MARIFPTNNPFFHNTLPYSNHMRNAANNKQAPRRATDRDYVEAIAYLEQIAAEQVEYETTDRHQRKGK